MTARVGRTQVGIAEWARRARASRAIEMATADALGRAVATTDDLAVRLALVGRARAHAWRATQWELVIPLLHDVSVANDAVVDDAAVVDAFTRVRDADVAELINHEPMLTHALVGAWQQWLSEASTVADAPYMHVIRRVVADANMSTNAGASA